jgi:hypothetical protein
MWALSKIGSTMIGRAMSTIVVHDRRDRPLTGDRTEA